MRHGIEYFSITTLEVLARYLSRGSSNDNAWIGLINWYQVATVTDACDLCPRGACLGLRFSRQPTVQFYSNED